jgi:hypothetical protein
MTRHPFIFSNQPKHRLARYACFWAVLCLSKFYSDLYGDSFSDVFTPGSLKQSLSSLVCFLPLYIFSAVSFRFLLLPRFLQKKRYAAFVVAALLVALCNFSAGIFLSKLHFKNLNWHFTGTELSLASIRTSIYQGIVLAFITTGGIVTAITLTKTWFLQQVENTRLTKLKSDKEIKIFKAQIHPTFLSQSLNVLREKIVRCEDDAPAMLVHLSELLSHLLYDSDTEFISLKQELKMSELLVAIKRFDKRSNFFITILTHGHEENKYINPLLLFSYLQTILNEADKKSNRENTLAIVLEIEEEKLVCEVHGYIEAVTEFPIVNFPEKSQAIEMANSGVYA